MAALRVLHVAPYFEHAWAYGGIPRVVAAQAHALSAAGHRVTVATTDAHTEAGRLGHDGRAGEAGPGSRYTPRIVRTTDGIDVHVFPNASDSAAYRWQFFTPLGFARFLRGRARDFDVAHLHACHNLLTALAATHLRRAGVPFVVQPNGTAGRIERRQAAKAVFDRVFARDVIPGASGLIAVTDWERRQFERDGAAVSRIHVVPNPLAPMPDGYAPERGGFREALGLSASPLVAYLGMLTPRKHPDILARAVAELGRQDVQLVFAGNDRGVLERTRKLVHRLGLGPRTRFTGLIPGPARYAALADADVVVYPSRDEAFGLVPLEALQAGTPVIVCDDAGCGEVVRAVGGGLLVQPGDASALAAATATILDDLPQWKAKAARAGADASRRFHPDVVASRLEAIYRAIVRER